MSVSTKMRDMRERGRGWVRQLQGEMVDASEVEGRAKKGGG